MPATRRTIVLAAMAASLLAACGGGSGGVNASDMTLGQEDAPVHFVEYASLTCPHCAAFHEATWPTLKEYIDAGRVKFTLREYAVPPQTAAIAVAGFQVARCGNASPDEYFNRVTAIFAQQMQIMSSGTMEGVQASLIRIGQASGLSAEEVRACITDDAGTERVQEIMDQGDRDGITGTPTFFINGERVTDPAIQTPEGMRRILDAALAAN